MFTFGHLIAARKLAAASADHVADQSDAPIRKKVSRSEIERLFKSDLQAKSEMMAQRAAL